MIPPQDKRIGIPESWGGKLPAIQTVCGISQKKSLYWIKSLRFQGCLLQHLALTTLIQFLRNERIQVQGKIMGHQRRKGLICVTSWLMSIAQNILWTASLPFPSPSPLSHTQLILRPQLSEGSYHGDPSHYSLHRTLAMQSSTALWSV